MICRRHGIPQLIGEAQRVWPSIDSIHLHRTHHALQAPTLTSTATLGCDAQHGLLLPGQDGSIATTRSSIEPFAGIHLSELPQPPCHSAVELNRCHDKQASVC